MWRDVGNCVHLSMFSHLLLFQLEVGGKGSQMPHRTLPPGLLVFDPENCEFWIHGQKVAIIMGYICRNFVLYVLESNSCRNLFFQDEPLNKQSVRTEQIERWIKVMSKCWILNWIEKQWVSFNNQTFELLIKSSIDICAEKIFYFQDKQ